MGDYRRQGESCLFRLYGHEDFANPDHLAYQRLYYFQRVRYGNGTSEAGSTFQLNGQASYQLSARASISGHLNWASEKNDELNIYEFERSFFSPGVNLWAAPTDALMLTLGYTFNVVESNAAFCPPLFDG